MSQVTHPVAAVGAVIFQNNTVLLVKRKNPPHANEWAIPGGKIQTGETLQQAAERETFEETGIKVKAGDPVFSFDLIEKDENDNVLFHYIIVDVECSYQSGEIAAKDDALKACWASPNTLKTLNITPATKNLLIEKYDFNCS